MSSSPYDVAALLGLPVGKLEEIQRTDPADPGNGVWFLWTGAGERVVLRRYHVLRTELDLLFEAKVLAHLTDRGWDVPSTVAGPIEYGERLWAATRSRSAAACAAATRRSTSATASSPRAGSSSTR